jgi:hypothetical protein
MMLKRKLQFNKKYKIYANEATYFAAGPFLQSGHSEIPRRKEKPYR